MTVDEAYVLVDMMREFFENQADITDNGGPNRAMQLVDAASRVLAFLEKFDDR